LSLSQFSIGFTVSAFLQLCSANVFFYKKRVNCHSFFSLALNVSFHFDIGLSMIRLPPYYLNLTSFLVLWCCQLSWRNKARVLSIWSTSPTNMLLSRCVSDFLPWNRIIPYFCHKSGFSLSNGGTLLFLNIECYAPNHEFIHSLLSCWIVIWTITLHA
jgi:hypothetical protein